MTPRTKEGLELEVGCIAEPKYGVRVVGEDGRAVDLLISFACTGIDTITEQGLLTNGWRNRDIAYDADMKKLLDSLFLAKNIPVARPL